jgi:hypothetical protein
MYFTLPVIRSILMPALGVDFYGEPAASSSSSMACFSGSIRLMQNAGNQNSAAFLPVKNNMLALLHATQPKANFIACPAECGLVGKEPATTFKLRDVTLRLFFAPSAKAIKADVVQVGLGPPRKAKPGHGAKAASEEA